MTLLEKLEKVASVELLTLNCNDGIALEITKVTPRIAKDFIKYQSIDETGRVYIPRDTDKLTLARWFIIRGCQVTFTLNQEMDLNLFQKWQLQRSIKRLNQNTDKI